MTHTITISPSEFDDLATGQKHFLLLRDTSPPLHFGDVLIFTNRRFKEEELPLVRHATYVESGIGLQRNWVAVELAP